MRAGLRAGRQVLVRVPSPGLEFERPHLFKIVQVVQQVVDPFNRLHPLAPQRALDRAHDQVVVSERRRMTLGKHGGQQALDLVLVGTDSPQLFNVPGFSLRHELESMQAAGLTPYEVLVTGTRNAARYAQRELLEQGNFGTVDDPPAAMRYTEIRLTRLAAEGFEVTEGPAGPIVVADDPTRRGMAARLAAEIDSRAEEMRAARDAGEVERRFRRRLLENQFVALAFDTAGKIEFVNTTFTQVTGYDSDVVI